MCDLFGRPPGRLPGTCPQGDPLDNEDCLCLNVWRPAGTTAAGALPVYVFIHGGGTLTFDIILNPHYFALNTTNAVTGATSRSLLLSTLLDASLTGALSARCCLQIGGGVASKSARCCLQIGPLWRPKSGLTSGFIIGSDKFGWTVGTNLAADAKIVAVTLNYRLGPLGFMVTDEQGDGGGLGNGGMNGLLDSIAALKFVQKHIGRFGVKT